MAEIKDLFEAYNESALPQDGGYIVTVFFNDNSSYTRFEAISYGNVKDIYITDDGLTFQADGRKLFVLYEPVNYTQKQIDPCFRDDAHRIPYRFKELEKYITKRQERIYIAKEAVETFSSFTVLNETGYNESYVVYQGDDAADLIGNLMLMTLWKNLRVPKNDAAAAIELFQKAVPAWMTPFGFDTDNEGE